MLGVPAELPVDEVFDGISASSRMSPEEVAAEIATLSDAEKLELVQPFIGVPFPPDDGELRRMLDHFDAASEPADEEEAEETDEFMRSAAGQFYLRVWLPCWIMHREYPPQLLFRARHGALDALEKLLRLDMSVVHDPRVAEHVHRITHAGTVRDRSLIANALAGKPKGKLDRRGVRYALMGLISQFALAFGTRVAAPDIARLFDGIERVRAGRQSDKFIPVGEALTKAVSRHRDWPSLPTKPDK